jgi:hypothetical protein
MNAATERMTEVLKARDWKFDVDEVNEMVNSGCSGENGQWRIRAGGINDTALVILSSFPVNCPEPKRMVCAELLTRINFGMPVACFEMDFSDGYIFCKTSIPYDEEVPKLELADGLLSLNLRIMDRYLPAIMSVIYAGTNPAKALADLEKAEAKIKKAKSRTKQPKLTGKSRFQMN